jgi:hypothetical protein
MGDYNLLDTYWALIFAMTTFAAPYALWVLWDYAKTIPRKSTSRRPSTEPAPSPSSSGSICPSSRPP